MKDGRPSWVHFPTELMAQPCWDGTDQTTIQAMMKQQVKCALNKCHHSAQRRCPHLLNILKAGIFLWVTGEIK